MLFCGHGYGHAAPTLLLLRYLSSGFSMGLPGLPWAVKASFRNGLGVPGAASFYADYIFTQKFDLMNKMD